MRDAERRDRGRMRERRRRVEDDRRDRERTNERLGKGT